MLLHLVYFGALEDVSVKTISSSSKTNEVGSWLWQDSNYVSNFISSMQRSFNDSYTYSANVVNQLFLKAYTGGVSIIYFFCRFDDERSLRASTIIRSLVRQCLDAETLSMPIQSRLAAAFKHPSPDVEELEHLLLDVVAMFQELFIVIDGVDECTQTERDTLFQVLHSVTASPSRRIKIFLSTRNGFEKEIRKICSSIHHVSMDSPYVQFDIRTYIEDIIDEKLANGDLILGNLGLREEIRDALTRGAQGMLVYCISHLRPILIFI